MKVIYDVTFPPIPTINGLNNDGGSHLVFSILFSGQFMNPHFNRNEPPFLSL